MTQNSVQARIRGFRMRARREADAATTAHIKSRRPIRDTAYYFFLTSSHPTNASTFLANSLLDYSHPKVNAFLICGVPIETGVPGQRLAVRSANQLVGSFIDLDSPDLVYETCEVTDSEDNNAIVLRIFDPRSTPPYDLPSNYQWSRVSSSGESLELMTVIRKWPNVCQLVIPCSSQQVADLVISRLDQFRDLIDEPPHVENFRGELFVLASTKVIDEDTYKRIAKSL